MDRRTLMMGAGAGVMAAGTYALLRPESAPGLPLLPQAAHAQDTSAATDLPMVVEMVLGNPDAPVEVIEYASFTCPQCASFNR